MLKCFIFLNTVQYTICQSKTNFISPPYIKSNASSAGRYLEDGRIARRAQHHLPVSDSNY